MELVHLPALAHLVFSLFPTVFAGCLSGPSPWLISHSVQELVSQRVYALTLGYEDLNDHDQLRGDPLLAVLRGSATWAKETLAGKSTLNRLELSAEQPSRYKKIHCRVEAVDELLTTVFVERTMRRPSGWCWIWK